MNTFGSKQPYEAFAISFDFTNDLTNETVISANVTAVDASTLVDMTSIILDSTKQSVSSKMVYCWVQNGIDGHNYVITCKIVGSAGSLFELEGILPVIETPITPATFDSSQFRLDFPEFSDVVKYTNNMIGFWAGIGDKMLNSNRWGTLRTYGMELFVAHNMVLQSQDMAASAIAGGTPGGASGLITSQSAGSISVSIDTQGSIEENGGNYNLTKYGTIFIRLSRMVGIGGLQL